MFFAVGDFFSAMARAINSAFFASSFILAADASLKSDELCDASDLLDAREPVWDTLSSGLTVCN